ncbi:aldose epimerase family protein [Flavobacterium sp. GT2N3]|uniref:aldose epimerase family protein n=1 Tax=unclassified Flavobacterium TaxID=196869 RepID=UPI003AAA80B5
MKIKRLSHFKANSVIELFGFTSEGDDVSLYELSNKNGMQLKVTNFGATITALKMPLKRGEMVDVVLGFDTLESYIKSFDMENAPYFGATIGRFAGRINNSEFALNGTSIHLKKNHKNHSIHGGNGGFSQKIWKVKNVNNGKNPSITLSYFSSDQEENFLGDLTVELTYTLSDANELMITYTASTTKDTVVNLTHHSYFNLDGHKSSVSEQELMVNSHRLLETTNDNIPTGRFLNLVNNPFDFSQPKQCPSKIDNTFILEKEDEFSASLFSRKNLLKMSVYTNQPAVHIYIGGNCFHKIKGKENADYHSTSGICFETQNFPDAPNHEHFPNSFLKKGEVYYHKTIYKFQSF